MTQPSLCVLEHHDRQPDGTYTERERPTLANAPARLCPGHDRQLTTDIARILDLAVELDEQMIAGTTTGPKITGTPGRALVGDLDAAQHQRILQAELASWCRLIAEERHVHLPTSDTLSTLVSYLQRHHLWIVEQPWIREYVTQIRDLHHTGRLIIATTRSRRVDLGPCDQHVSCDVTTHSEQACTGTLRATVHQADTLLPASITCTSCGNNHAPDTWRTLGRHLRGTDDLWLTGPQLSQLLGIPWGTLRYWANQDQWRRRSVLRRTVPSGRVQYAVADAEQSKRTRQPDTQERSA
jgi:hypothetical protein